VIWQAVRLRFAVSHPFARKKAKRWGTEDLWNTQLFGGVCGRGLGSQRLQIADKLVDCVN
jgi:uncharacterized membrane protein YsdA (DUF1294 family)